MLYERFLIWLTSDSEKRSIHSINDFLANNSLHCNYWSIVGSRDSRQTSELVWSRDPIIHKFHHNSWRFSLDFDDSAVAFKRETCWLTHQLSQNVETPRELCLHASDTQSLNWTNFDGSADQIVLWKRFPLRTIRFSAIFSRHSNVMEPDFKRNFSSSSKNFDICRINYCFYFCYPKILDK